MPNPRDLKETEALSDAELAKLIEHAQRRMAESPTTSVADAKSIAADLDIPLEHIEAALGQIRADRAASARALAARKERRRLALWLSIGIAVVLSTSTLGLAWSGAGSIDRARSATDSGAVALRAALDRQASLVPTLASLHAGSSDRLLVLARQMGESAELATKRSLSQSLALALAEELAALPTGSDPAQAQARLSLQYEIVGTQNRITVEGRRYDEAMQAWRHATSTWGGRLARLLGLAKPPA